MESRIDADRALESQLRQERREDKDRLQQLKTENLNLASQLQVLDLENAFLKERYGRVYNELAEFEAIGATPGLELPEAVDLLNRLKSRRKRSATTLADVEAILDLLSSQQLLQ